MVLGFPLRYLSMSIWKIMEEEKQVIERQDGTNSHAINRRDLNIEGRRQLAISCHSLPIHLQCSLTT